MITLSDVTKKFNDEIVLRNINLHFKKGFNYVVIGLSGCGKSTLLKIIAGLLKPNSGKLFINGKEIDEDSPEDYRGNIGYVIQEGGLFPHLTAEKNILLQSNYFKAPQKEADERMRYLLELTKLPAEFLSKFPSELSGGQRQRIAIIRALMMNPDILLLDEPLGALDPIIKLSLRKDLKEIFESLNKTVIMVTHDLSEADYFGDEIILLKNGRTEQVSPAREFFDNPVTKFAEDFINANKMLKL